MQTYHSLKKAIQKVVATSQRQVQAAKLKAYWQTGKLIVGHVRAQGGKAGYGHNIVNRLAADLETNQSHLYRCVEFYDAFPIFATWRKLDWSHYKVLLSINNSAQIRKYQKLAVKNNWTVRQLQREIKKLKLKRKGAKPAKKLTPRRGVPGTYAVTEWHEKPAYDLGFSCYKVLRKKRKRKPHPSKLFTYHAKVERVIDGDTLWAKIKLGFGFGTRQKLRLRAIDAPELRTKKGKAAKAFLADLLRPGEAVIIKTSSSDKYDRYLADVFLPGRRELYVNQLLVDEGHARLVSV